MSYFFYILEPQNRAIAGPCLKAPYSFELWKPSLFRVVPNGVSLIPFGAWWIMHHLRIFDNRDYSLLLIRNGTTLIHRSGVFPGYLRFPFMSKQELQIGDTWTHPEYRKQGLASFALEKIVERYKNGTHKFWYLVEEDNLPSIRAVERAGFVRVAEGVRTKRFGLGVLGSYVIQGTSSQNS